MCGEVWRELFDDPHSLAPDLMNSQKWHNLLVAIQEDNVRAVARPGVPQPLAGVLRNVAFAKQRWDSTAGPVAKLALMLLPAATLLAHIASDRRRERDQRERATALLKQNGHEVLRRHWRVRGLGHHLQLVSAPI